MSGANANQVLARYDAYTFNQVPIRHPESPSDIEQDYLLIKLIERYGARGAVGGRLPKFG